MQFVPWPKTPRLFRPITVTEKIDGTNAAIHVNLVVHDPNADDTRPGRVNVDGSTYLVAAQSRKRLIDPTDDNYGFAAWVRANAATIVRDLGEGIHYGEWWGSKIARSYGLTNGERRLSLFNVARYSYPFETPGLGVVPVIGSSDVMDTGFIRDLADRLRVNGSLAAPGFDRPEGLVIHHSAANSVFKVLLEGDDLPKGLTL